MRKIRLTERQLDLITEEADIINDFKSKIDKGIERANGQLAKLAFASIAEIIDNVDSSIDLNLISQEMTRLDNILHNQSEKLQRYFDSSMDEKEYWAKWEKIHQGLENEASTLSRKINAIQILVANLEDIADLNIAKEFSDVKPKKL